MVTGTRGFLGRAIAEHLRGLGHEVAEVPSRENFSARLKDAVSPGADVLIHAGFLVRFTPPNSAAPSGNLDSARAVAEACQAGRVGQLIFIGAAGVCGVGTKAVPRGERLTGATDPGFEPYLATEYVQEKLAATKMLKNSIHTVAILHPTTVYGIGMQAQVVDGLRGRLKLVPPGGTSGVSLADFLRAVELVITRRTKGTFLVNGENFSFRSLFRWSAQGSLSLRVPLPFFLGTLFRRLALTPWGSAKGFAVHHSTFGFKHYSSGRIQRELGWHPQVAMADAIKEALDGARPSS